MLFRSLRLVDRVVAFLGRPGDVVVDRGGVGGRQLVGQRVVELGAGLLLDLAIEPGELAALAGGVAGIAVVFKTYWRRIVSVFSKKKRAEFEAEDAAKAAAEA